MRAFAHSIVVALNTFDRIELIHGDLKPENIVLQSSGRTNLKVNDFDLKLMLKLNLKWKNQSEGEDSLKNFDLKLHQRLSHQVIDFGSSCYEGSPHFTYVQSRYYRAPEVKPVLINFFSSGVIFRFQQYSLSGDLGRAVHSVSGHVEPGMYTCRAPHRLTSLPWR